MAPSVARAFCAFACLAAATSAAAVFSGNLQRRDATDNPRYTPLEGTDPSCVWWWNSDDGLSCSLLLMVVGISEEDFIAWNPSITPGCGNYIADKSYCIKVDVSDPTPTSTSSSSKAGTSTVSPISTTIVAPGNGVETPTPIQPGMVDNCDAFHFVERGEGCQSIASMYGISLDDFVKWNAGIGGAQCTSLWAGVNVCVSVIGSDSTEPPPPTTTAPDNGITTPTPTQPGMVGNCEEFHHVEQGQSCATIVSKYEIAISDFVKWNDVGGLDCTGLWADVYVCISVIGGSQNPPTTTDPGNGIPTPSPVREGMVKNCNDFYLVKSGDGCASIAKEVGIPLEDFYEWNPASGKDCSSLWLNTWVCTGTTTYKPTPTDPGNGVATPSPIQNGMTKNCDQFHLIRQGQNCEEIAKIYGTSVYNIIRWNPAAGSECTGLWTNTYACVGVL
ncbi:hypothetical protein K4F52_009947 [Lecanicillium sp. MT-2017a]|nr:hypothetical protein K4F52_009947 [Lecanicillium sp. MT-2017a]